jgi:hypothetical protein
MLLEPERVGMGDSGAVDSEPLHRRRHRRVPRRTWHWWAVAFAITLAAVSLSVALGGHRRHDPALDVFDEGAHYAYVVALRSGHIPAWGDTLSRGDREFIDCLSEIPPPPVPCGATPVAASEYAAKGYDYEAQQPPLGYLPFVLTANPQAPPQAALAAARHGGIVWVGISGFLLLVFAVLDELSLLALAALLGTCLLNPVFTYAAGTVNNDAAGVAAGVVALLAWTLSKSHPRWGLGCGLVSGILIGLTKGLFVVVPFALVVAAVVSEYPVVSSLAGAWIALKRNVCVVTMFGAACLSYIGWTLFQNGRATVPSSTVLHAVLGFTHVATLQLGTIGSGVMHLFNLFQPYYPLDAINVVWSIAVFGVILGTLFLPLAGPDALLVRGLSVGILAAILALAVGWPLLVYLQGHYNFAADARYAIPILPLAGYVVVKGCRRFGIIAIGLVLPVSCAILQLVIGKY